MTAEIARLAAENGVEAMLDWAADNDVVPLAAGAHVLAAPLTRMDATPELVTGG